MIIRALSWTGFLLLGIIAPLMAEDSAPLRPLGDEEVVRLFVSGISTAAIIETIQSQQVDFDLSTEMQEELALAGLPATVINAMIERQAAMNQEHSTETKAVPEPHALPPLQPDLSISIQAARNGRNTITLPTYIPRTYFDLWNLRGPDAEAQDIAIFLACSDPLHVPDHWRSKSPLGKDFSSIPRHRMLAFISGATVVEAGKDKLVLEIPSSLTALLEAGETHDLILGVAVRAAGRMFTLQFDEWADVATQTGLELHAEIKHPRGSGYSGLKILFKRPADGAASD